MQTDKIAEAAEDIKGCVIALLGLGAFAAVIGAVIFGFLGIATQRKLSFETFGYPSVPNGTFTRISVLSSDFEHNFFGEGKDAADQPAVGRGVRVDH